MFYGLKIRVIERYTLSKIEIKDYNVMIDGKNFFDIPIKNNIRTNDCIRKILKADSRLGWPNNF